MKADDKNVPFIQAEIRPSVQPDLNKFPALSLELSEEEINRQVLEIMGKAQYVELGLADVRLPPEAWNSTFTRNIDVLHTVLDGEAVILNLSNGFYYSLNPIGTVIWELFKEEQPLQNILRTICERYDVTEDTARSDLAVLVTRLHREGLIKGRLGDDNATH